MFLTAEPTSTGGGTILGEENVQEDVLSVELEEYDAIRIGS